MGLETGTFISDLVATNPIGASDPKSQGDDHIRLIKATVKASFPNVNGAVNPTPVEFNYLVGVTSAIQGQINDKADAAAVASALGLKADDDEVVKLTGAQTVGGAKTFSDAPQVPSLELGHASDTTLTRIAAGRVSIEGGEIAKLNGTEPFTESQRFFPANGTPLRIGNAGAPIDAKNWRFEVETGTGRLNIKLENDLLVPGQNMLSALRDGSDITQVILYAKNRTQIFTQVDTAAPATTGAQIRHADGNLYDIGMNVMPLVTVNSNITFARTHVGKLLLHNEATARDWTTPSSSDTDLPIGSTINLINLDSGAVSIVEGSGVTVRRFDGTGAPDTGTHTLARGGIATLYRSAAGTWYLWGNAGLS
jgi:hypothetical protein